MIDPAHSNPFETHVQRYEDWFERHPGNFVSELLTLRALLPWEGEGLEVGVGSGRFAAPLGVRTGLDPSSAMLALASTRGIKTVQGVAENLPFPNTSFDYGLIVTTLCFVQSPERMLSEIKRVLRLGGRLVIGFIDRASPLGQHYQAHQAGSLFYRNAVFYSADEVNRLLTRTGFHVDTWVQTLTRPPGETTAVAPNAIWANNIDGIEPMHSGHGSGGFVVVGATKMTDSQT
ncbi:MAG TPA: class I SAM-dependent methyltransferase [bacterium]|nr:class I SAM-dependent methyltransferase [bacterium]